MTSPSAITATVDLIGEDLLHNIVRRLPATSFASAACVSRSWNVVCDRVLSRPKLASACSFNHSLQAAVGEVVNKVLSEPIRPHFAIASVTGYRYEDALGHVRQLINAALGTHVPVIINRPYGIIGRDAISDEFKEIWWYFSDKIDAIMLIVGFLPGLKAKIIPLLKQIQEPRAVRIDEFVTDIRDFSTSVSGCNSPAAVIMICGSCYESIKDALEKLDYAMSPETVVVGNASSQFRCTNDAQFGTSAAVALVFAVDMNKPPGIGETQFHVVLSSGLSPVGPTYKITSVNGNDFTSEITARREGSGENIDGRTILDQACDEIGDPDECLLVGVTKKREYSIAQENVGCMTSLAFLEVPLNFESEFYVPDGALKTGDAIRVYHTGSTTALSSAAAVSSHLRSFNQGSNNTTDGEKLEVFGGLIFTSPDIFSQPDINSSPFLDNFPGVTLGGNFCSSVIGRRVLTPYVKESHEQMVRCSVHFECSVFLIMCYTPLY